MVRGIYRIGFGLGLSLLMGCQRVTTVKQVQANPHRNWFNATVHLQGTVGDRAPLVQGQLYELQDQTGSIWVLSPSKTVKTGDQVLIKGMVRYEAIDLAGREEGEAYIEEQEQLDSE